ncbi:alpha-ketoacid dehydrogenase subunit alpha/beta [Labilibaculum euxinus]|uniref:alpha-ketoacid dehydrogenase subunit alpha/beta n=1 Tax=Labilibaculum euxinus TaxID=2686357 RepID=UPI001CDBA108|nr:alpha-ketoacid dehydrogenase subunit alpha/beta [Labilibaculum euxinus]MDQ1769621.1 thiamine pyrophosphate-dependent enzyme [Labilibaculum euxinus]
MSEMVKEDKETKKENLSFNDFTTEVLEDYRIANVSRQLSIWGRKEVLTGKAKFGIFGDGKEVAQIAMAKAYNNGDWRSGYYRDQTFMLASGMLSSEEFFAQLFGETRLDKNPANGGRLMNNHYASRSLNEDGSWKNLTNQKNSSADISPTAGQMPRLLGLAYASKMFRQNKELHNFPEFSDKGNEVAFGTIGDSSTSEGHFWETINAAGVLQVPMAMSVWDDGWGISVPNKYQTTKSNISEVLKGFEKDENGDGYLIYKAKGWDYASLCKMYMEGVELCRKNHVPVLFHVTEMTQPLGHSTSGSHERYKTKERLDWENEYDPIKKMREWILSLELATEESLDEIENAALEEVKMARKAAWKSFSDPILEERDALIELVKNAGCDCKKTERIDKIVNDLKKLIHPVRKDNFTAAKKILRFICSSCESFKPLKSQLQLWLKNSLEENHERYSSHLYSETDLRVQNIKTCAPVYSDESKMVNGREVLRDNFDKLFSKYPLLLTFGEDTGFIGGVNQSLEGMQKKYGDLRVTDTGIRESTILGQGIGLALRGLRPIAEIQYFDYLLYALQTMSDDLATLQYRTKGGQKAPVIIRTRGHRLEGIWHSGSPLSMVINSIRGIHVCVPRDMTKAAGFYNTLLESDEPALVIEPLNGYRLKEKMPDNLGEFNTPLGIPEVLEEGTDITLVTYGSCVRIAEDAVKQLKDFNISVELIDVQTLLPFDINSRILESVKKTNRIVFFDEDVPGGATAFMMQKVLEDQNAYYYLDSEPRTITAKDHRPAYGTDGDYFSNPNAEDVFQIIYDILRESNPQKFPPIYTN